MSEPTEKTFKVLVGCQNEYCAEEVSYHLDHLRWWNDEPICEGCFDEVPSIEREKPESDEDDPDLIDWSDLETLTIEQARA